MPIENLLAELLEQQRYAPDTYIGQLCGAAAAQIEALQTMVTDLEAAAEFEAQRYEKYFHSSD